jgi:ArsR family transcriptional regulator, arsenate/arsenite/antimonite-responsive transcriptional repressor
MEMSDAVAVLDALAQETRLSIYRYLIRRGPGGAAAGDVGAELQLHAATLSFHLGALRKAGLVLSRRESRSIIYSADFERMTQLIGYLTDNCCRDARPPRAASQLQLEPARSLP